MKTDGLDHFVYRLYDEFDELIYVGLTTNFDQRMKAHSVMPWFPLVHHHTLEPAGTDWRAALKREAEVIRTEEPLKNINHSTLPDWMEWNYTERKRGPWEPFTPPTTPEDVTDDTQPAETFRESMPPAETERRIDAIVAWAMTGGAK